MTYTIVVTNNGLSDVTGATVSGYVPGHLVGSHLQQRDDGHGERQHRLAVAGDISDTVDMTAGATITYTVTGTIDSDALSGSLANTATVSSVDRSQRRATTAPPTPIH